MASVLAILCSRKTETFNVPHCQEEFVGSFTFCLNNQAIESRSTINIMNGLERYVKNL